MCGRGYTHVSHFQNIVGSEDMYRAQASLVVLCPRGRHRLPPRSLRRPTLASHRRAAAHAQVSRGVIRIQAAATPLLAALPRLLAAARLLDHVIESPKPRTGVALQQTREAGVECKKVWRAVRAWHARQAVRRTRAGQARARQRQRGRGGGRRSQRPGSWERGSVRTEAFSAR